MQPQTDAVHDSVTVYRREGYAERVMFDEGQGNVSFATGQYACQLEVYVDNSAPGVPAAKIINHVIGADPTEAIMVLTPADLSGLKRSGYTRRVVLTSPSGEVIVLVDGPLKLL